MNTSNPKSLDETHLKHFAGKKVIQPDTEYLENPNHYKYDEKLFGVEPSVKSVVGRFGVICIGIVGMCYISPGNFGSVTKI